MKKVSLTLLPTLALIACVQSSPYEIKRNSQPEENLSHQAFQTSTGAKYKLKGYVEMFAPNYFVIVGADDGRSLADDFDGSKRAASEAVRRFDCKGGTELKDGSRYSEAANEWLIVVDCKAAGRKLTGT